MIVRYIRALLEASRAIRRDAAQLIGAHGRVEIDRRLGIGWQADTATRYFEGNRR